MFRSVLFAVLFAVLLAADVPGKTDVIPASSTPGIVRASAVPVNQAHRIKTLVTEART